MGRRTVGPGGVRSPAAAVLGAVAVLLAVAVAVCAVFVPGPTIAGRPTPGTSDEDRAAIYLALLGGAGGRVFIIDRSCGDVGKVPSFTCTGPAIPAGVQARIRAAHGGEVRFGSAPLDVARTRTVVVGFGEPTIVGGHARLGMEMHCGPLCGSGTTYLLTLEDGAWHITGRTGSHWIS